MDNIYKRPNGLDTRYKPLILKWLARKFGYKNYPNSHKDQWITWDIWNGTLSVSFDTRQVEHRKLMSKIPPQLMGTPQRGTLDIVNKENFYVDIHKLLPNIEYPEITGGELIEKIKHKDNDGDTFYVRKWVVSFSDGSKIYYTNQEDFLDIKKGDYLYLSNIQIRAFTDFLDKLN